MKNIFLFIAVMFGLLMAACNPMEDINKEIDKMNEAQYSIDTFDYARETAPSAYTLTDDDYALSSNADVAKYKNFSASVLPKDYLPEILNKKFTAPDAFEMIVTYNYYSKPVVDSAGAYEISSDEYAEMGQGSDFSNEDEAKALIGKLLDRKVYASDAGTEMTVMYVLYKTNQTRFVRVNADMSTTVLKSSSDAYVLTDLDYEDLGEGTFHNFYKIGNAEAKLPTLATLRGHTLPQDYSCLVYKNYFDTYVVYMYNGTNWVVKESLMAVSEPLNYSRNTEDLSLSTWWADPALKITLGTDDYDMYSETSKYQNFDLRPGSIIPGDDRAKLVEMIGVMLDANHAAVDDQQYLVTYAYYNGSNGIDNIRVIRTAGVWSEYTE